ncbi:hypothetical protein [Pseudomonas syringae group genomosp. 3]|uniref:Uncharacterized protein n=1 Tax=Pseudomonas syringae pv. maculicola TaxID=59511 RepID=A0A3M6CL39_PSEYM|nr:hypothetical protein [Pseudomonas syringae group genomosp. 3]RMV44478.1 hypothetical protein ALP13_02744 [Pseudomonas syringae pv. maculicola]
MALTQKQRDERTALKRHKAGEEELRLRVRPGTKQALSDLMAWARIEEQGEALTWMIHHVQELGRDGVIRFIGSRHRLDHGENVAHITGSEMIRFRAMQATRDAMACLVDWSSAKDQCAAMRLVIHALHECGPLRCIPFLTMPPREPYVIPERYARLLDAEAKRKTLRICHDD